MVVVHRDRGAAKHRLVLELKIAGGADYGGYSRAFARCGMSGAREV